MPNKKGGDTPCTCKKFPDQSTKRRIYTVVAHAAQAPSPAAREDGGASSPASRSGHPPEAGVLCPLHAEQPSTARPQPLTGRTAESGQQLHPDGLLMALDQAPIGAAEGSQTCGQRRAGWGGRSCFQPTSSPSQETTTVSSANSQRTLRSVKRWLGTILLLQVPAKETLLVRWRIGHRTHPQGGR